MSVLFKAIVAFRHQHTLREKVLERFVKLHEPHVTHDLGPETRIEQVQHRVFNPTDVLIHRHPVVVTRIDHRGIAIGRAVALEVPGAIDERIHRVRFALCIGSALRALHI